MPHKKIKLVDDGSRYTVWQSTRKPDNSYNPAVIVAEHLNKIEALKLVDNLNIGIVGFTKESEA